MVNHCANTLTLELAFYRVTICHRPYTFSHPEIRDKIVGFHDALISLSLSYAFGTLRIPPAPSAVLFVAAPQSSSPRRYHP